MAPEALGLSKVLPLQAQGISPPTPSRPQLDALALVQSHLQPFVAALLTPPQQNPGLERTHQSAVES